MLIAVLNQSTLVTNDEAAAMVEAVAHQIRYDFAPAWDKHPDAVVFYADPSTVPTRAKGISIVDTITDAPQGVLGYHTENAGGRQWGIVAAKPSLDNGAQVLVGDWSVSSILSHEVLEMAADPSCSFWGSDGQGSIYCLEVCDPVEAPTYVEETTDITVSNFITPAWFDPEAGSNEKFDHLGHLDRPFSLLPGGYVVYASSGQEQQKFGDRFPEWRREMKSGPAARTQRRIHQFDFLGS